MKTYGTGAYTVYPIKTETGFTLRVTTCYTKQEVLDLMKLPEYYQSPSLDAYMIRQAESTEQRVAEWHEKLQRNNVVPDQKYPYDHQLND